MKFRIFFCLVLFFINKSSLATTKKRTEIEERVRAGLFFNHQNCKERKDLNEWVLESLTEWNNSGLITIEHKWIIDSIALTMPSSRFKLSSVYEPFMIVCSPSGKLAAIAIYSISLSADSVFIHYIVSSPVIRQKGKGTGLILELVKIMNAHDYKSIIAVSQSDFFPKLGFSRRSDGLMGLSKDRAETIFGEYLK